MKYTDYETPVAIVVTFGTPDIILASGEINYYDNSGSGDSFGFSDIFN